MSPTSAPQSDIVDTATTAVVARFPETAFAARSADDIAVINTLDSIPPSCNRPSIYTESLPSSTSPADTSVTRFFCGIPIRSFSMTQQLESVRNENMPPSSGSVAQPSGTSIPDHLPSAALTTIPSPVSQSESCPLQQTTAITAIGCAPTRTGSVPPDTSRMTSSYSVDPSQRDVPTSADTVSSSPPGFLSGAPGDASLLIHTKARVPQPEPSDRPQRQSSTIPRSQLPTDSPAESPVVPHCNNPPHSQASPSVHPAQKPLPILSPTPQRQASIALESETSQRWQTLLIY